MKLHNIFLLLAGASSLLQAQTAKLDSALSALVDSNRAGLPPFTNNLVSEFQARTANSARFDSQGRVLVDIHLDGSTPLNTFVASLTAAGAAITGVNPSFRFGSVSAFVPVGGLQQVAALRGLRMARLTNRPRRNVGAVTSQGVQPLRSDVANTNGFVGTGITVGVLSDSYDTSPIGFTAIRAANDIASNDLPVPKFVADLPADPSNIDEGRAMMQIVRDVAPGADLCFATAFLGEASFAANIRALRTNPACNADVIVDDVFYVDEPFFSDGEVAQAANDVVTSNVLAGKKTPFFSSAGNQGGLGGGGSIDVLNATFSTTPAGLGNINLATTAACASFPAAGSTKANTGGGWLDFGGGNFFQTVNYFNGGSTMIVQWDDRFYQGAVTTDLNWFLFNAAGNCVFTFAGNNIGVDDNGLEYASLSGGASGVYRIMVSRTSAGTNLATHVRMVNLDGFSGAVFAAGNPVTFGHAAAAFAIGVAAYRYDSAPYTLPFVPVFESFSSPGPSTIHFDGSGNRLAVPEVRKKPDIAAPDGGDTTFFFPGSNFDGTGFPNFLGTSASAPHAAGVAALLLQKAGGPTTLTPAQIKSIMQTTAPARVPPVTGGPAVKGYNKFDGFGFIDAVLGLAKIP